MYQIMLEEMQKEDRRWARVGVWIFELLILVEVALITLILFTIPAAKAQPAPTPPVQYQLIMTEEEQGVLIQLIDLAVKAGGLNVAGNADFLARKIKAAPRAADKASSLEPPKEITP